MLTAILYPGIIFSLGVFINFFIWGKHSSGAIPFTTMLSMGAMWFGISLPLVYIGYFFGYRQQGYEQPVRTNQIPRQVPTQIWYMNPVLCTLMSGNWFWNTIFSRKSLIFLRNSPLWRLLHWTFFHILGGVWESVLLLVWLFVSRFCHSGCVLQSNQHCYGLLPTLFWKLPLVVAKLFRFWWLCHLRYALFGLLLLDQVEDWRIRAHFAVFYLHLDDGRHLLAIDGNHWILRGLFLHQKNLRRRQDWLRKVIEMWFGCA